MIGRCAQAAGIRTRIGCHSLWAPTLPSTCATAASWRSPSR